MNCVAHRFEQVEPNMTEVTLYVPNISCMHCVHTIKTELSDLAGVQSVEADKDTKMVEVKFDAPATQGKIETLLAEIDYPDEKLN
jgi:copper chaperone